jgi:site-specific recombinase XerC
MPHFDDELLCQSGPHGVRSGLNMHRARHTFGTELRRVAGVEPASQARGHSDLSTTVGIYGHQDQRDLEHAMEAFAEAREAHEAEEAMSRGNDSSPGSTDSLIP